MLDAIKKRRSYREYQEKEVDKETIEEILKAAMFSPSSHHRRPWEFVVVTDQKKRDQLAQATPWADFIAHAPVAIVVCSNSDHYNWIEDCSIAAENIYLEATNQGLGTCFVQIRKEGDPSREKHVRKVLDIPENVRVLCVLPIGYPKKDLPEHGEDHFQKGKIHQGKY